MKVPPWKRENWEPCHVHAYFSPKKSTKVIVDASPVGMAGMLMQGGEKWSATQTEHSWKQGKKYSQTDWEMLAVIYGAERFNLYIFWSTLIIITDHKPLLGIRKSPKLTTARIELWHLWLVLYKMRFIQPCRLHELSFSHSSQKRKRCRSLRKLRLQKYCA